MTNTISKPQDTNYRLLTTRLVFFGTSSFAVPVLEALVRAGLRPVLVVTTPDAPVGRKQILSPSPIKAKALELGLEIIQPKTLKDPEVLAKISTAKPDVGVLTAYGKIVPKVLIDAFSKGILNIHPSLLPRWRGPAPIQATILAGDEITGVTIILMDEEVDHGKILAQQELEIRNWKLENYETLHDKLAKLGAEMITEVLPQWMTGRLSPVLQEHTKATFCKKFTREHAKIDWSKSAQEIERMVRALNPEPGTWTTYSAERLAQSAEYLKVCCQGSDLRILKILAVQTFQHSQECRNVVAGRMCEYDGKPVVQCGKGALILERVQPEGKKPMSGDAFLRGNRGLIGKMFSACF